MIARSRVPSRRSSWPSRRCSVISVPRPALLDRLDGELAAAVGLPAHALVRLLAGAAGQHRHLVGDDERGIEAHAELADQVRVLLLVAGELREELARAGLGDRAEVGDRLLAAHADAVVGDGERARLAVVVDADLQVGVALEERRVGERLEAQLVAGVGGVGDELAQEDLAVRVQRVDHQVQELLHLGLEAAGLALAALGGAFGHGGCSFFLETHHFEASRPDFKTVGTVLRTRPGEPSPIPVPNTCPRR